RLTGQPAQTRLPVKVAQLLVVEPQGDLVRTLAFSCQRTASRTGGISSGICWHGTFSRSSSAQSGKKAPKSVLYDRAIRMPCFLAAVVTSTQIKEPYTGSYPSSGSIRSKP